MNVLIDYYQLQHLNLDYHHLELLILQHQNVQQVSTLVEILHQLVHH